MAAVRTGLLSALPRDARPGRYRGGLGVEAQGLPATTLPVELTVADWTLPDSQDWATWVGMIQSPDSLALEYGVPLWSQENRRLIARSFDCMKAVGCRNVYVPLLCRTNFGNEESMVRWIRKEDGTYTYDFTIMDRYLAAAHRQRLGDELAGRCEALLNERQRAMWKTIWTVDEDLAAIDEAHEGRGPTEGLWKAMEKAGKPLPGYWDGQARKMRRDEAAKGKAWFATSGWQQRNARLFALAGEVAGKLRSAATPPTR